MTMIEISLSISLLNLILLIIILFLYIKQAKEIVNRGVAFALRSVSEKALEVPQIRMCVFEKIPQARSQDCADTKSKICSKDLRPQGQGRKYDHRGHREKESETYRSPKPACVFSAQKTPGRQSPGVHLRVF